MSREKVNGIKFGPGHFPLGTVALVKVMDEPYELRVDRILEQSAQGWLIESDLDPHPDTGKKMVNVGWVVGIVSRGTGPCKVVPYTEPVKFTQKRFEKQEPYAERCYHFNVGKNEYVFDELISDIRAIVYHYPQYAHLGQQHLYDFDAIAGDVIRHARQEKWYAVIINKKKFHRVLKASLARRKIKRTVCQKAYQEEQDRWGEEMMRDMWAHDEEMLDESERKFLAEQHEKESESHTDNFVDADFDCLLGEHDDMEANLGEPEPGVIYRASEVNEVMDNTYMVRK